MVFLLTQTAHVPPHPPRWYLQIILCRLRDQNLRLLRQARYVRKTLRRVASTSAHEALLRVPMHSLRANVARLALGVLCARLRRDRDRLRVLLICVVLLGTTGFPYLLTELVMSAFFPVLRLAGRSAVACAAAAAFLSQS